MTDLVAQAVAKMVEFYNGNTHDVRHFIKVHSYAATIGRLEGLDEETLTTLELAAIVHDIAIPLCREKYGSADGKHQEQEGPALARKFMQELGVEISSCDKGTDFLGRVVYPNNTLVNATYINEGDDVMYEYGTNWFTKLPEGATVLVQNAGKTPMQGCICLTDEELTAQFNQYNNGVVGFEYQSGKLDMALFANVLNHKIHQTDEYTFISNFIFSRSLTTTAYEGVAQPENPDPVNPGKPEEPGKPDAPKTGDSSNIILWVLAASFSCVMIPAAVTLKRKAR